MWRWVAPLAGAQSSPTELGIFQGLIGGLNTIGDNHDGERFHPHYLYADNVSINDSPEQPNHFEFGEALRLEDAHGDRMVVRVILVVRRTALLDYERPEVG